MKAIKLIIKLIFSILIQTLLLPFRFIVWIGEVVEKIFRVLKNTTNYLIEQVESEALK